MSLVTYTLVNGLPILVNRPYRKGVRKIIVDRGEQMHIHRYVTALWREGNEHWYAGSYWDTIEQAIADLNDY